MTTRLRAALEQSLSSERFAQNFVQQIEDQRQEAEAMRSTYLRLRQKLEDTAAEGELLLATRRRTRNRKLPGASAKVDLDVSRALKRLKDETLRADADTTAALELDDTANETLELRMRKLEREGRIDALLLELKSGEMQTGDRLLPEETR